MGGKGRGRKICGEKRGKKGRIPISASSPVLPARDAAEGCGMMLVPQGCGSPIPRPLPASCRSAGSGQDLFPWGLEGELFRDRASTPETCGRSRNGTLGRSGINTWRPSRRSQGVFPRGKLRHPAAQIPPSDLGNPQWKPYKPGKGKVAKLCCGR